MKANNTLLTVLLITLLPSLGWSTPLGELMERDGLYYPKFSDVPFTGKVTGKTQGYLKDGRREGNWLSYHDNGQLKWRNTYKQGKTDGVSVGYYSNGNLHWKSNYKNGEEDTNTYYSEDGEIELINHYKNGVLDGPFYIASSYDETKGQYKNGKRDGAWSSYYRGRLRYKGNYKNGEQEGVWVRYHENGERWVEKTGTYKDGVKISD